MPTTKIAKPVIENPTHGTVSNYHERWVRLVMADGEEVDGFVAIVTDNACILHVKREGVKFLDAFPVILDEITTLQEIKKSEANPTA